METSTFEIEVTDTFGGEGMSWTGWCWTRSRTFPTTCGGEANYCWVKRFTFQAPRDCTASDLIRRAKRAAGLTLRHKPHGAGRYDDLIRLDFYGACICAFITYQEGEA